MNSVQILKKAKSLIENPDNWTQKAIARKADGSICSSFSEEAVCFCALGALSAAVPEDDQYPIIDIFLDKVSRELYGVSVATVNDFMGHKSVMIVYDEAIKKAEGV